MKRNEKSAESSKSKKMPKLMARSLSEGSMVNPMAAARSRGGSLRIFCTNCGKFEGSRSQSRKVRKAVGSRLRGQPAGRAAFFFNDSFFSLVWQMLVLPIRQILQQPMHWGGLQKAWAHVPYDHGGHKAPKQKVCAIQMFLLATRLAGLHWILLHVYN